MDDLEEIPFLDVTLSRENVDDVVKVLKIRPAWSMDEVELQDVSEGLLNTVYLCKRSNDATNGGAIIVKTRNELFLGPMESVRNLYEFCNKNNLGPRALLKFRNGLVWQYIPGECLDWNSPRLKDHEIWKQVAEQFARWHCRAIYNEALVAGIRTTPSWMMSGVADRWTEVMETDRMRSHKDELPTTEQLLFEERDIRERLAEAGDMEPALVHGDINGKNAVVTPTGGLAMIDLDFSGIMWSEYELAWYFYSYFDIINNPTFDTAHSPAYRLKFLAHYLKHRARLDKGRMESPTAEQITRLYERIERASPLLSLRIIVGASYLTAYTPADLSPLLRWAKQLWKDYYDKKKAVFGKTAHHMDLETS